MELKDSNKLEIDEYKCPFCGIKRRFINSLMFDEWIVEHKCNSKNKMGAS